MSRNKIALSRSSIDVAAEKGQADFNEIRAVPGARSDACFASLPRLLEREIESEISRAVTAG